jgi:hypothetical protein
MYKLNLATLIFSLSSLFATTEGERSSFFRHSAQNPYHLSIGAVLFDDQGRIACHHFQEIFGYRDVYILMRETMKGTEPPFVTLARGLKEEWGATAEPVAFVGNLSGMLPEGDFHFEKTTLYVVCKLTHWDSQERDVADPEASSVIEWIEPEKLILLMQEQGDRFRHQVDVDESEMVRRAIPYIRQKLKG